MKRTFILVALIAALVAPIWAQNQGVTPDGIEWYLTADKKGVIVQGYSGTALAVRIPDRINNLPVVEIDLQAFSALAGFTGGITSVVIPNTVTKIGDTAFQNQTNLTSITLGTGIVEIGTSAFSGCSALTSISLPASIKTIGRAAFNGCTALTTVSIPASVTKITFGDSAFRNANNLNAVTVTALTNRGYKF
jgi:hypothetical protein